MSKLKFHIIPQTIYKQTADLMTDLNIYYCGSSTNKYKVKLVANLKIVGLNKHEEETNGLYRLSRLGLGQFHRVDRFDKPCVHINDQPECLIHPVFT